jgi:hypothetical protein
MEVIIIRPWLYRYMGSWSAVWCTDRRWNACNWKNFSSPFSIFLVVIRVTQTSGHSRYDEVMRQCVAVSLIRRISVRVLLHLPPVTMVTRLLRWEPRTTHLFPIHVSNVCGKLKICGKSLHIRTFAYTTDFNCAALGKYVCLASCWSAVPTLRVHCWWLQLRKHHAAVGKVKVKLSQGEWIYRFTLSWPRHYLWVISFTPLPLYPRGKSPRYPLDRRLGGPQSRSGRRGEEKILDPPGTRAPTPRSSSL